MYRIFYADYIPSLNKGELTILQGMLESFQCLGEVEVALLSYEPKLDAPRYGSKVKAIDAKESWHLRGELKSSLSKTFASIWVMLQYLLFLSMYKVLGLRALSFMKAEIWQEYVKADVIIMGHGGIFGIRGSPWFPVACYPLLTLFSAKVLGKPVALYGGSSGLPKQLPWFLQKAAKFVLNMIDLITLRESTSYQNLKNTGVRGDKLFLTADPAFLLRPVSPERAKEIMIHEGIAGVSMLLIGMTITRHIASKAFSDRNGPECSYRKHIEVLAQAVDDLTDRQNATVVFIPHCIGLIEQLDDRDDRTVAEDIFQRCNNKEKVKVITNEYGAEELKGLIGQFDFFIGERMHSVINAMSMCVPSIALSHSTDPRLSIIEMLGQEEAICYVEDLDADALIAKVEDIWAKRDEIKEKLKRQVKIMRERALLNSKLLKELLDSRKTKTMQHSL